ncbi:MAG: zinc ribbon domain-containing protein [Lachnospiraceae bacterium]|nr:zinc ribbon domain-containing protein [Lachnospiraceae bacterium]
MSSVIFSVFLGALIAIAVLALTVLLGIWTYRDAENKGMIGVLWTAVVILVPSFIGLIIYLIVRMDHNKVTCSNCNMSVDAKNRYCSNCGVELVPVVDASKNEEEFRKSQRNILIGFFSTIGAVVILGIFMIAFLITGALKVAEDTVKWVSGLDAIEWGETLEDALGNLDLLFDEDEIHVAVEGDEVTITDRYGNKLVHVDGSENTVDIDLKDIKILLDKYHIKYDDSLSEKELEQEIREQIREQLEEIQDDYE